MLEDDRRLYQMLYDLKDAEHPKKGSLGRYGDSKVRNDWFISRVSEFLLHRGRLLDVGCGRCHLMKELELFGFEVEGTEIARTEEQDDYSIHYIALQEMATAFPAGSYDAVVCSDVLEHVDPPDLYVSLANIWRVARDYVFISVGVKRARNFPQSIQLGVKDLHRVVERPSWWDEKISFFFEIVESEHRGQSHYIVCRKRPLA